MVQGSLNFFFNYLNIQPSSWKIQYDFSSPSGSGINVPSLSSGDSLYSGQLSSVGNYYSTSGSGNFTGNQSIKINNASGLATDYFTTFFCYEKQNTGNAILFSSLQSGVNISGFICGVNDANKLYFETYDQNGAYIVTSQNIISSKNAIALVKSNNILNIHYYNFNEQIVESEAFQLSSSALYQSNQVYLAATGANTPSYITQNSFSGYLSEFMYINLALTQNTVQKLFSGFYCAKNPDTVGVVSYSSGAGMITGGATVYTGIGTGITGSQVFLAGTYIDFCGNLHSIYSYNSLTGIISGFKFFPLTGAFIATGTGIIDQGYNINTGFAASFGMDGFAYNRHVTYQDFSEFYTYPAILNNGLNNIAIYNLDGTFKLDSISANNQLNLYANGVVNLPSGVGSTGTVYQQYLVLSGDYYISGQSIISNGMYLAIDALVYDYISGQNEIFNYTGGAQTFVSNYPSNRMIYLNGQKLISGSGYNFAGNNLQVNLPITGSGIIMNFPAQTGFINQSGYLINLLVPKYARGSSQLWLNGIREEINNDYYEISKIDLLNASGLFADFPNTIYNNNTNFIEPF